MTGGHDHESERRTLASRQAALLETSIVWLDQALALVQALDDDGFTGCPPGLAPHRVGSHLRHVLEFYECFLEGMETFHVDYDARRRDLAVEQSREVAAARIREIVFRLRTSPALLGDGTLWVRIEDAEAQRIPDSYLLSSVGRELQSLSSHAIHHFALIAIVVRAHGFDLDADFGMAPSTLRYQANHQQPLRRYLRAS